MLSTAQETELWTHGASLPAPYGALEHKTQLYRQAWEESYEYFYITVNWNVNKRQSTEYIQQLLCVLFSQIFTLRFDGQSSFGALFLFFKKVLSLSSLRWPVLGPVLHHWETGRKRAVPLGLIEILQLCHDLTLHCGHASLCLSVCMTTPKEAECGVGL